MNTKSKAEFFRLALITNVCTTEDVIRWIDLEIENLKNPDPNLIEISLVPKANNVEIYSKLANIPGEKNASDVLSNFFGYIKSSLLSNKLSYDDTAKHLYEFAIDQSNSFPSGIKNEIIGIDDAFDLAKSGQYGTMEEAKQRFLNFLDEYSVEIAKKRQLSR